MKKIGFLILSSAFLLACQGNAQQNEKEKQQTTQTENMNYSVNKSEEEWKSQLSDEEYRVLRQKGTEMPHTGEYNLHFEEGTYKCAACNQKLFESDSKFETTCGWPSFDKAIEGSVEYQRDTSHGMIRTEILCSNCGSHLGHVFNDGPTETGKRFCINSVSLDFINP